MNKWAYIHNGGLLGHEDELVIIAFSKEEADSERQISASVLVHPCISSTREAEAGES
jgi:hypothetical protein